MRRRTEGSAASLEPVEAAEEARPAARCAAVEATEGDVARAGPRSAGPREACRVEERAEATQGQRPTSPLSRGGNQDPVTNGLS